MRPGAVQRSGEGPSEAGKCTRCAAHRVGACARKVWIRGCSPDRPNWLITNARELASICGAAGERKGRRGGARGRQQPLADTVASSTRQPKGGPHGQRQVGHKSYWHKKRRLPPGTGPQFRPNKTTACPPETAQSSRSLRQAAGQRGEGVGEGLVRARPGGLVVTAGGMGAS